MRLYIVVITLLFLLSGSAVARTGGFSPKVESFMLVNADTNTDIGPLEDDAVLGFAIMNPSIRAVMARCPDNAPQCSEEDVTPSMVHLTLKRDGTEIMFREERFAPFLMSGDLEGLNVFPLDVPAGKYELLALPFDQAGNPQREERIEFEIRDDDSEFNGPVNRRFEALEDTLGNEVTGVLSRVGVVEDTLDEAVLPRVETLETVVFTDVLPRVGTLEQVNLDVLPRVGTLENQVNLDVAPRVGALENNVAALLSGFRPSRIDYNFRTIVVCK